MQALSGHESASGSGSRRWRRRAEPHRADHRWAAEIGDDLVVQRQHGAGSVEQPHALYGRLHAARGAHQQGLPEGFLKSPDLHRDGRLRAPDAFRRAREGAALGDQHEGTQQVGVEARGQGKHGGSINPRDGRGQYNAFP
jgi:hypothetical protein